MNINGRPIKQFCPKGHDTFICGRYKNYGCRDCNKNLNPKQEAHKRNLKYKRKFGITLEQYNQMFNEQKGLCLGCYIHRSQEKRAFAVDHCHKTGKIRGLLCGNCNVSLGNAKDNPEILRRLADYLESR